MTITPRRIAQFSLRSLIPFALTIGSVMALWRHWHPYANIGNLVGHTDKVVCSAVSSDGKTAVTGSLDNTTRVWDVETRRELARLDCGDDVYVVAISTDKTWVMAATLDNQVFVWSPPSKQKLRSFRGFSALAVPAFSASGNLLAIPFPDEVRIIDTDTGGLVVECEGSARVERCLFSADSALLIASSSAGLFVFDASTGKLVRWLQDTVMPISSSPTRLLAMENNSRLNVYDTARWTLSDHLGAIDIPGSQIAHAALTADGNACYSLGWDSTLRASVIGGEEFEMLTSEKLTDRALSISADGQRIVTTGADSMARVWQRARPIGDIGVLWLPEFWLAALCSVATLLSLLADWKRGHFRTGATGQSGVLVTALPESK